MINLANMRPSVQARLNDNLQNPKYAQEILDSLVSYLIKAAPDGGMDSDRLQMIGLKLTNADAWIYIEPALVMERAGRLSAETLIAFTSGMPDSIARQFQEAHLRVLQDAPPSVIGKRPLTGHHYVLVDPPLSPYVSVFEAGIGGLALEREHYYGRKQGTEGEAPLAFQFVVPSKP